MKNHHSTLNKFHVHLQCNIVVQPHRKPGSYQKPHRKHQEKLYKNKHRIKTVLDITGSKTKRQNTLSHSL